MKLNIHMGVHKTGTSAMQHVLLRNRKALSEQGVGYVSLGAFRKGYYHPMASLAQMPSLLDTLQRSRLSDLFEAQIAPHEGLPRAIVTEENLAGPLPHLLKGRLYTQLGRNMRLVHESAKAHDRHYFLCIRAYDAFFVSAYLQLLRKFEMPSIPAFVGKLQDSGRGWADLAADMIAIAGAENVTVWTYEAFRADPQLPYRLLSGGAHVELVEPRTARDANPSLSAKGLQILEAAQGFVSKEERIRLGNTLRFFEFDPPVAKVQIEDKATVEALSARYRADKARIASLGCAFHDVEEPADQTMLPQGCVPRKRFFSVVWPFLTRRGLS
ncbi:hypothetical protein HGO38_24255 [Rhizobium sp. CG5]|uniref:hypothetical protein n=1 Tax=Rhizobium sp. CG5 TaxID=2726076 RepID=UPI0020332565|nr:hypothetical protein [Rhizobium sp. CG5]MCM2476564.1 hypothetical protein [Rhizobium sp. CG5]